MLNRVYHKVLLLCGVLLIFSLVNSNLLAQEAGDISPADTSYFRDGKDEQNLLSAVLAQDLAVVDLLLDRGVNPDALSETGNTSLMYATEKGNIEIMNRLLEAGADINASGYKGETPLFIAIFMNDFQAAKFLLESGVDPNVKDFFGVTPLIYAAATNQYPAADLLLFYGADPAAADEKGNDAMISAVTFQNLETTDVLLQNDLSPNVQDKKGNTPAIIAAQHGTHSILELLLEYNANVELANNKGYTPLAYAVTYRDVKATQMLMDYGADVNHITNQDQSIADLARIAENDTIIQMVNEKGGKEQSGPHFSTFHAVYGNAFNGTDYLIQFRFGLTDSRYGFYFETGSDYRPFLLKIQREVEGTTYQFREQRIGWSHTFGKYFMIWDIKGAHRITAYTALTGYMSFPEYPGTSIDPGLDYNLIPAIGISYNGGYAGVKAGVEYFNFGSDFEKGLKFNVSALFRISFLESQFDRKEIYWE